LLSFAILNVLKFFILFHIVCFNSKFPPPVELCWQNKKKIIWVFFFKLPFPFFAIRLLRYLSVGRFFNSFSLFLCLSFLQVMRRGSGALSSATHAHSTSHSQTYTTTFIHPWAPFPTGLESVLISRWWPKEC
jgi:hypothetical protein